MAVERMKAMAATLPQNFVGADQTGPLRSGIQAGQNYVPEDIGASANFIGGDQTQIAAYIAINFRAIPPYLADILTARIIFERRQREIDEAPLPRRNAKGDANTEFHLYQQVEFQKGWNDKLEQIDKRMAGTITTANEATTALNEKKDARKKKELDDRIEGLRKRIENMIGSMPESVTTLPLWGLVSAYPANFSADITAAVIWLNDASKSVEEQSDKDLTIALAKSITTLGELQTELSGLPAPQGD